MSKLHIPVGLPGCGKSTLAKTIGAHVISTDAIRLSLTGNAEDQSRNDDVFKIYHQAVGFHLQFGSNRSVYADATNLRDFARQNVRDIAERIGAETHLIVFTNTAQAVERNLKRDRVVPPDVMVRFIAQFEQALRDIPNEQYTSVTYIEGVS